MIIALINFVYRGLYPLMITQQLDNLKLEQTKVKRRDKEV